jgi:hypothetical protein
VGGEGGVEWVVREGVGAGGRNDPSLYAHMNNKRKKNDKVKKKKRKKESPLSLTQESCIFFQIP